MDDHEQQPVEEQGEQGKQDADRDDAAELLGVEMPDQREGTGLYLIHRGDLEAAIGEYTDGEWEDTGSTSREDAVRKKLLVRYRDDPDLTWKRHLVADDAVLTRLDRLANEAPNMAKAVAVVRGAAVLSRHARQPLRLPPLVLIGPPGTGKSRIASMMAAALGTTAHTIVGSTIQDTGPLTGYGPAWRGAGPGIVAKALLGCKYSTPLIVIDEAEKIASYDHREHPLDALLSAMEPSTACCYKDGYYDVRMRAQHAAYVICANGLTGLSRPLLDRCVVVEVPELSPAERHRVLEDVVADIVLDYAVIPRALDPAFLAALDGVGLRRAKAVVAAALAAALAAGRDWPDADDLRAALDLVGGETPSLLRRPVGFIHF